MTEPKLKYLPQEVLLVTSELQPPEPLVLTIEAAEQLQAGQYVRMLHRREPCMLYNDLGDSFSHYQRDGFTSAIEVFIWRKDDNSADNAVQAIVGRIESSDENM